MSALELKLQDKAVEALDRAVAAGLFPDRQAALEEAVRRLAESIDIADGYRRAYSENPEDERHGAAGLSLLADRIRAERSS